MKSWKEYPHLFSNGKFKVQIKNGVSIFDIIGYSYRPVPPQFLLKWNSSIEIKYCTLIARKIEDMTDEEIKNFPMYSYKKSERRPFNSSKGIIQLANDGLLFGDEERYLSSLGIYFLSQSHFDNGTVIDIKTI